MIPCELCKKLKFDLNINGYMHKPESVLENKMHKILWDYEILTDLKNRLAKKENVPYNALCS